MFYVFFAAIYYYTLAERLKVTIFFTDGYRFSLRLLLWLLRLLIWTWTSFNKTLLMWLRFNVSYARARVFFIQHHHTHITCHIYVYNIETKGWSLGRSTDGEWSSNNNKNRWALLHTSRCTACIRRRLLFLICFNRRVISVVVFFFFRFYVRRFGTAAAAVVATTPFKRGNYV